MKSTFKTLFYLKKNEPKKNGHVVIMVRITVDGDQVENIKSLDPLLYSKLTHQKNIRIK